MGQASVKSRGTPALDSPECYWSVGFEDNKGGEKKNHMAKITFEKPEMALCKAQF